MVCQTAKAPLHCLSDDAAFHQSAIIKRPFPPISIRLRPVRPISVQFPRSVCFFSGRRRSADRLCGRWSPGCAGPCPCQAECGDKHRPGSARPNTGGQIRLGCSLGTAAVTRAAPFRGIDFNTGISINSAFALQGGGGWRLAPPASRPGSAPAPGGSPAARPHAAAAGIQLSARRRGPLRSVARWPSGIPRRPCHRPVGNSAATGAPEPVRS